MTTKLCPKCKTQPTGTTSSGKALDYCTSCQNQRTVDKQRLFKSLCVSHKGGACSSCGYNNYQGALCLPVRKDLRSNKKYTKMASLTGKTPLSQRVRDELAQRELLCMNCYRESLSPKDNKVKQQLVAQRGGACSSCGYTKRAIALDFHHVDGTGAPTKSLNIGSRTPQKDYTNLVKETQKCVLLCANCHCEHHRDERSRNIESK